MRLSEIKYLDSSSAIISKFNYTYDAEGDLNTWKRQTGSGDPSQYTLTYDGASQLTAANDVDTTSSSIINDFFYIYDAAGNRTSEQINAATTSAGFNNLNQLTSKSSGGLVQFNGNTSQFSTVTVGGIQAAMSYSTNFVANVTLPVGTNTVPVIAKNYSNLTATNNYQVVTTAGTTQTLTYDSAGNLTNDGTKTYEWDAVNRLTAINYTSSGNRTELSYDGLNRRTKIVEKNSGGTVTSTKQFVWVDTEMCEERDASNSVTRRFYPQGEQIAGTNFYTTADHLGSRRQLVDSSGNVVTKLDFDSWGRMTLVSGTIIPDFGFANMYQHLLSGSNLTLHRIYLPDLARWLSRDPLANAEMSQGSNLYSYCGGNPTKFVDRLGLTDGIWGSGIGGSLIVDCCCKKEALKGLAYLPEDDSAKLVPANPCDEVYIDALYYTTIGQAVKVDNLTVVHVKCNSSGNITSISAASMWPGQAPRHWKQGDPQPPSWPLGQKAPSPNGNWP